MPLNLPPIPDHQRTICTTAYEALTLARKTESIVRVILCPESGGEYRVAVGPDGEWEVEDKGMLS